MRGSLIAIVRSALLRRARAGSLPSFRSRQKEDRPTVRASAKDFATMSFIQQALVFGDRT